MRISLPSCVGPHGWRLVRPACGATGAVTICIICVVTVGSASLATRAAAQQPAPGRVIAPAQPAAPLGSILGVVADSLHGVPLVQASVTVVQLPRRSAMTAPSGAFRIDSLPPGTYTLEVLHPLLDSLGIRLVSDSLTVTSGGVNTVVLSVPPAARLVQTLCPPMQQKLGPAAVVGQVLDADTGAPVAGADVSAAWVETEVSLQRGVHTAPRLRTARTGADGSFRLCGLPRPFNGSLQAVLGTLRTAEVRGDLPGAGTGPLTLRVLRLPSRTTGVVTGRVTNHVGLPLPGAAVTVRGDSALHTTVAKDGTFTLSGVPTGTQVVLIRQIGYVSAELAVDVTSRAAAHLTADLGEYLPRLASVQVQAPRSPTGLEHTGFLRRQKTGIGRYLTDADIEKMQPVYASDVLRHIAGLHVLGSGHDVSVTTTRGEGCVRYMVDNNTIDPSDGVTVDELVNPADIAGLEFYQALEIPAALTTGRDSGCALLVIWTRAQVRPAR